MTASRSSSGNSRIRRDATATASCGGGQRRRELKRGVRAVLKAGPPPPAINGVERHPVACRQHGRSLNAGRNLRPDRRGRRRILVQRSHHSAAAPVARASGPAISSRSVDRAMNSGRRRSSMQTSGMEHAGVQRGLQLVRRVAAIIDALTMPPFADGLLVCRENDPPDRFLALQIPEPFRQNRRGLGAGLDRCQNLERRRRLLVKMDQYCRTPFRLSLRTDLAMKNEDCPRVYEFTRISTSGSNVAPKPCSRISKSATPLPLVSPDSTPFS